MNSSISKIGSSVNRVKVRKYKNKKNREYSLQDEDCVA